MEVDKSLLMKPEQLQSLIDSLLEGSEQCPEDILNAESHPSDQTLVKFAELIYTEKKSKELDAAYAVRILSGKVSDLTMEEDGWKLLITVNNTNLSNGYFGAAFVHIGLQQVVVAHRGTDPKCLGALYTDIQGVLRSKYTSCMNSATTFVDFIRQAINSANDLHRHYTLTITGHSLGAWLAQITTFSVKYLAIKHSDSQICLVKNSEVGIHAKTVGFDSPGARDMLERVLDDYYDRYERNVLLDGLNITLYLSAPNHINTCGVHLGKIYRVFNDASGYDDMLTDLIYADDGTVQYTFATHGISNFIKALIIDKNGKIGEVTDWAKSSEEFNKLFKILNWDNNYHFHARVDKPDELKKYLRYKVAKLESPENAANILKSSFRVFSEVELQMLIRMHILQEQQSELTSLKKFIINNKFKVESTKLLPKFSLNHYNRTITCESGESLAELCKRLKQLMRWLKPQFTQAVEEQIKDLKQHVDFIYYVEGQSYLDSLPKCFLDFTGSDGFKKFLVSDEERILCLVTSSKDVRFKMIQLWNILHQISDQEIRCNDSSDSSTKYISEKLYTFIGWSQLQKLKNYGWPVEKDFLMVVDCTSSSITESKELIKDVCSKSLKLVLIVSESMDTSDSSIFNKTVNFASDVTFSDLTPDSQQLLFNRGNVITSGGKEYSFESFLGEDRSVCKINHILSSEFMKNFATIENYAITIEDTRPTLGDIQMPFFKLNIKTCTEFFASCVKSPDTNILVVMSGLSREDLETGASWNQLKGMDIILAEGDAQLSFRDTCKKNQDKRIYLFDVLGQDVYCKEIYYRRFYLPRKFLHLASIDIKKFAEINFSDNLFIVYSEEDKSSFLGLIENSTKREALTDNIHTAVTKEIEVDIIQKYFVKNIHFLKIYKGIKSVELKWRYSHGSVESLFPCLSTDSYEPIAIDETALSKTKRNLVIITDEPGMGKTTSLARLSRLVESPWVIYIELKYFQAYIDKLPEVLTAKSVARFLLSECRSEADGLLEYLLESKTNSKRVVLMFDGFDEIDDYIRQKESSKNTLIKLFVFLQGTPAIQTFITARTYLKESLEKQLRQTCTSFVKINAQEQQHYLFVFWHSCLFLDLGDYGEGEEERLKEYAGEVLRKAKKVLGPDMDCFMGVPLQLRMLAEVFRPQSDQFRQSPEALLKDINIVSAPDLYKKFIDLKYNIYLQEKTSKDEELDKEEINQYLKNVTQSHGELAFKLFFPDFYEDYFDPIKEEWLNKLNRHGLVQANGSGGFQFVHRTYAEYCCAQMIVYWLNQPKRFSRYELFKEILIPQILLHPDSKIIRLFMNVQLNETAMSKSALEINAKCINQLWLEDNSIFRNEQHQTVLHIAVLEMNVHIATLLLRGFGAQEAFVSFITQQDLNGDTAMNCLNKPKLYNNRDELVLDELTTNILQHVGTWSYESKKKIFFASLYNRNVSNSRNTKKKFSFARFFNTSVSNSDETAEEFFFKRLFHQASRETKEELIVMNLFYGVIRNYLNCTSTILARVKEVESVIKPFGEAVIKNNVKLFKNILFDKLDNNIERYCLLLMKHKNHGSQTVLHLAVGSGHLDMVQLLEEQTIVPFSVLIAQMDDNEMTSLHTAARRGHLNIVKYLLERGAAMYTHRRTGLSRSVLVFAVESGKLATVKYLVEIGADIHTTDNLNRTVLHWAAMGGYLPIVEYLLQLGMDPHRVDRTGGTALTMASRGRKLDVVRFLLKRGVDVNADGGIALYWAIRDGDWSMVEALVDKGAAMKETEIHQNLSKFKEKYPNYEFKK